MRFNIEDYPGNYVMHCPTEESAEAFTNYLHQTGRKWNDGQSYYPNNSNYCRYQEKTLYYFNAGLLGSINKLSPAYKILDFYEFDWTSESPYEESDITLDEILGLGEIT